MAEFAVADHVDITDQVCPMTYVKVKLRLEMLEEGDLLEVILNDGEPMVNVPRSAVDDGNEVVLSEHLPEGDTCRLVIKRGAME